jgi:HSP20 family molecular chaperone IbpA
MTPSSKEENMATLPVQRRHRVLFPEIADLLAGFPSWGGLRAFDGHVMRLEDELKDGSYEVRAELPCVDPAKDVDITVRDGQLTIKAEPRLAVVERRGPAREMHGGGDDIAGHHGLDHHDSFLIAHAKPCWRD